MKNNGVENLTTRVNRLTATANIAYVAIYIAIWVFRSPCTIRLVSGKVLLECSQFLFLLSRNKERKVAAGS